ncbi:Ribosomal protein L24e [mine drainage metagenome]|uniref:Ribosomal protein L24e n=1 Tax=mine drainage metagenome TaxID=410659 RepID=T1CEJ1_9ZZZZ
MVTKRQCSFCADEIEPGTGTMYVKRDGTVYHFCSASCRKQQLQLHRVGQRFKWTRAYALQKAAAARHSAAPKAVRAATTPSKVPPAPSTPPVAAPSAPSAPAPSTEPAATGPAVPKSAPAARKKPSAKP